MKRQIVVSGSKHKSERDSDINVLIRYKQPGLFLYISSSVDIKYKKKQSENFEFSINRDIGSKTGAYTEFDKIIKELEKGNNAETVYSELIFEVECSLRDQRSALKSIKEGAKSALSISPIHDFFEDEE